MSMESGCYFLLQRQCRSTFHTGSANPSVANALEYLKRPWVEETIIKCQRYHSCLERVREGHYFTPNVQNQKTEVYGIKPFSPTENCSYLKRRIAHLTYQETTEDCSWNPHSIPGHHGKHPRRGQKKKSIFNEHDLKTNEMKCRGSTCLFLTHEITLLNRWLVHLQNHSIFNTSFFTPCHLTNIEKESWYGGTC